MRQIVKNVLSTLLIALLLISCIMTSPNIKVSAAESGICGYDMLWTLDDEGTLTITGTGDMKVWTDASSSPWYKGDGIKKVIIGEGVTNIGDYAFYRCYDLTDIELPNSIVSIGDYAFNGCEGLKDFTIPDSLTSIGEYAFSECSSLTSIAIPDSVKEVGDGAFVLCSGLVSAIVGNEETNPDSTISIGSGVFSVCENLTSITIGSNVEISMDNIGSHCSNLERIDVSNFNPFYSSVDGVLFNKDKTLLICYPEGSKRETYTIPNGVTTIGSTAFWGCSNLKEVHISEGVKTIEALVFKECHELLSITIPNSLEHFDERAIEDCGKLTDVYYNGTAREWNELYIEENSGLKNVKIHFLPTRLAGLSFYDTANAIANEGWESAEMVVLANGLNYADALAGVPLAFKYDAPILLTAGKAELEPVVMAQIEKLAPKKIVLLGGSGAVSNEIANALSKNYEVERVYGASRYSTAVEIAKKVSVTPTTAIVVTGTGYADALAISPYAAMKGLPIVYSNPNTGLTAETLAYLKSAKNIYIIGGDGVVRQNAVEQLNGKNIERIFGSGRYETALAIAERFDAEFVDDKVMFATGTNFPDALAGGVLGAKIKAPLLLTHPNGAIEGVKNYVLEKNPSNIYLLGGTGVVPDSIVEKIYE